MKRVIYLMLVIAGCSEVSEPTYNKKHYESENYNPEVIRKNKISVRRSYEVYSSNETVERKLKSISFFNENGQCTLKVSPRYFLKEPDANEEEIKDFDKAFNKLMASMNTNIPTGLSDSVFYLFDEQKRLVSEITITPRDVSRQWKQEIKIEYDKFNNVITRCVLADDFENHCNYSLITYDKNGRIITKKDSTPGFVLESRKSNVVLCSYKYDNKGNIVYDGKRNFEYYEGGKISKENEINMEGSTEREVEYTYDKEDYLVAKKSRNHKFIFYSYYLYDERNLLIQEKNINNTDSIPLVVKYYYE